MPALQVMNTTSLMRPNNWPNGEIRKQGGWRDHVMTKTADWPSDVSSRDWLNHVTTVLGDTIQLYRLPAFRFVKAGRGGEVTRRVVGKETLVAEITFTGKGTTSELTAAEKKLAEGGLGEREAHLSARREEELKNLLHKQLEEEKGRILRLETEVTQTRHQLKTAKKELREAGRADTRISSLNSEFNRERAAKDDRIADLLKQLEQLQERFHGELARRQQTEGELRGMEQQMVRLHSVSRDLNQLTNQKTNLEKEFADYRLFVQKNFVERTQLDDVRRQMEERSRLELNKKFSQVNDYMKDQTRARAQIDNLRDMNIQAMKGHHENERRILQDEMSRLRSSTDHLSPTDLRPHSSPAGLHVYSQQQHHSTTYAAPPAMNRLSEPALRQAEHSSTLQLTSQAHALVQARHAEMLSQLRPVIKSERLAGIMNKHLAPSSQSDMQLRIQAELDKSIVKARHVSPGGLTAPSLDDTFRRSMLDVSATADHTTRR